MEWPTSVTIEHRAQALDAHKTKADGEVDQTWAAVGAAIQRPSNGNLWRIFVEGDFNDMTIDPDSYRVTAADGRVFAPFKATYRAPTPRVGTNQHTLILATEVGEKNVTVTGGA